MSLILVRQLLKLRYCQLRWLKTPTRQTPAEYCLNLVRQNDYENFLCTLLLPSTLRSSAIAIRAFNTEIATIEDQITDSKYGLLRIKFWEEALNDIYNDKPPKHPTALELHRILQKKKLSKHYFKRLIDARFNKLSTSTFTNLQAIENYAENTVSSIYYLLLQAHGINDINTDHFASHLGKAHGMVTLIRSVPYNAQKRSVALPQDILMKHNVSYESIFQKTNINQLKDVIFEISSTAKQHLNKAISLKPQIKNNSHIIFLPYVTIEEYLKKLERTDFDVFSSQLQDRSHLLPLKLFWKKISFRIKKISKKL